jgi:hypothetical protein
MANTEQVAPQYSPLHAQKGVIETHWQLLLPELKRILPRDGAPYLMDVGTLEGITGNLICGGFPDQKAIRERGPTASLVPLLEEDHSDFSYWLSLHQGWRENHRPQIRGFIYHTTSITVYFGHPNTVEKIQLFRAEWPGVRVQREGKYENFIFEAPGAGHPHWQFDAYQSRAGQVESERQRLISISRTLDELLPEVENFGESVVTELVSSEETERFKCMQQVTRIHFASHANWAIQPWRGDETNTKPHTRGPATTTEILNWITSSLSYIQRELNR